MARARRRRGDRGRGRLGRDRPQRGDRSTALERHPDAEARRPRPRRDLDRRRAADRRARARSHAQRRHAADGRLRDLARRDPGRVRRAGASTTPTRARRSASPLRPGMSPIAVSERALERFAARRQPVPFSLRPRPARATTGSTRPIDLPPHGADPPHLRPARGAAAGPRGGPRAALGRATPRPAPTCSAEIARPRPRAARRPRPPARAADRRPRSRRGSTARQCRRAMLREHGIEIGGGLGPAGAADVADRAHGPQRAHARRPTRSSPRSTPCSPSTRSPPWPAEPGDLSGARACARGARVARRATSWCDPRL